MSTLSPELNRLFARAGERGVDAPVLSQSHLESLAALLEVTPGTVETMREALAHPVHGGEALASIVVPSPTQGVPSRPVAGHPASPDARRALETIRAAGGEDHLLRSPLETVAVLFGIHPFLAEEARDLAQAERTARA